MTIEEVREFVCEEHPLYRPLIMALRLVKDNDIPTMGTDGESIFYNQDFFKSITMREAAGVILHETLHCAHRHLWRRDARNHTKFNIACDYAINPIVLDNFPLPKGTLLDMRYNNMSAEEIYDALPNQKKSKSGGGNGDSKGGKSKKGQFPGQGELKKQKWGDHSKWPGQGKKEKESLKDKILGKKKGKTESENAELDEKWKELFEENIVKNYGKLPDSLKRIVEKNYYIPTLDWSSLVASLLSEDQSDYSFAQPDRRFLEADYMLPDLYSVDRLKDVVFAYDTSGSITQNMLQSFFMETLNLFDNFSSLQGWLAVCDWDLHSFKPVDGQSNYKDFNFIGGGGTSFNPVFEKVKKEGIRPKALFYFTDTYGDFPSEDPGYPVFWLVPTSYGEKPSVSVPFGTVIPFIPKM